MSRRVIDVEYETHVAEIEIENEATFYKVAIERFLAGKSVTPGFVIEHAKRLGCYRVHANYSKIAEWLNAKYGEIRDSEENDAALLTRGNG